MINNQPFLIRQSALHPLFENLIWNIPEQKSKQINLIGGNSQNFSNTIRVAESANRLPIKSTQIILPDSVKKFLPTDISNIIFVPSTPAGSINSSSKLKEVLCYSDANLFIGETSKNSATNIAIIGSIKDSKIPNIITRDTVDLISSSSADFIQNPNIILILSITQLQKIFRNLFFPKVLLLSMPLPQVLDNLHKFTLSFPITIVTFHNNQLIVASAGKVCTTPISDTKYTPLTIWSGSLALKTTALSALNPKQLFESAVASILF